VCCRKIFRTKWFGYCFDYWPKIWYYLCGAQSDKQAVVITRANHMTRQLDIEEEQCT